MGTLRLTTGQALIAWLKAQRIDIDGQLSPLFPGVFAIFGHGNVTCLGEALEASRNELPTWRGQNEQSMAMAAIGFTKAQRRRQIMVATSSIGPGALNMVTAAGIAMANRLPVLLLSGDTFASRIPDPVLQQVEHFGDPSTTVNDAFRAVTRYWDRITRPEQLLPTLPQATSMMLDPATSGPAFLGLAQDAQSEAYDYPESFFEPHVWRVPRPIPDESELEAAGELLRRARRPLVVVGGGVRYSGAEVALDRFLRAHGLPAVETVAGRGCLTWDHPNYVGPVGVTGADEANRLTSEADVILAVGTRLQDFTTGSWTVFGDEAQLIGCNAARFDALKHRSLPVVGDALVALESLKGRLEGWKADAVWTERARTTAAGRADRVALAQAAPEGAAALPSYSQVIGVIARNSREDDYLVSAAGGLPGELNANWPTRSVANYDCEYGFSCMGYEIAGAWGAKMARPDQEVISFVGDGSWLMHNSEVYSTVSTGHKVIYVLCDNGGYAVIDRLQRGKGAPSFNNMVADTRRSLTAEVDFAAHARAMGANAEDVASLPELGDALERARRSDRSYVLVIRTDPDSWSDGGAWWEVGVPEVNERSAVQAARAEHLEAKRTQRVGI